MYYIITSKQFLNSFSEKFYIDSNLVSMKNFSAQNLEKMINKTQLEDWNISSNISNKIFSFLYYLIENKEPQKIIHLSIKNSSIFFEHWKDFSFFLYSLWKNEKEFIINSIQNIDNSLFTLLENFSPIDFNPNLNLSLNDIDFNINHKQQNFDDIIQRLPSDETLSSYLSNLDPLILDNEKFLSLLWAHYKKNIPDDFPSFLFNNEKFLQIILNQLKNVDINDNLHAFWEVDYSLSNKQIKNKWNFLCILLNHYDEYKIMEFPYIFKFDFDTFLNKLESQNSKSSLTATKIKILTFFKNNLFNDSDNLFIFAKCFIKSKHQTLYLHFFNKEIKQQDSFFSFLMNSCSIDYTSIKTIIPLLNNYLILFEKNHSQKEVQNVLEKIIEKKIPLKNIPSDIIQYFTDDFVFSLFNNSNYDKEFLFSNLSHLTNSWRVNESFIEKNIDKNWFMKYKLIPKEKILYEKHFSKLLEKKQFYILLQLDKPIFIENFNDFKQIIQFPFFFEKTLTQKKIKEKIPNFEQFLNNIENYKLIYKHHYLNKIYPFTKNIADKLITDESTALQMIMLTNSLENIPLHYLEKKSLIQEIYQKNPSLLKLEQLPNKFFFQKDFIFFMLDLKNWSIIKKIPLPIWQDSNFLEKFIVFTENNKNYNDLTHTIQKNAPQEIIDIFILANEKNISPMNIFKLLKEKRVLQQSFSQDNKNNVKKLKL